MDRILPSFGVGESDGNEGEEVTDATFKLGEYLDKHGVKYRVISHTLAYTAQGIAALTHTPGKEMAKTVVVKIDGKPAMAVLPASFQCGSSVAEKGQRTANKVELSAEEESKDLFPECETGAMPPFGNLYGLSLPMRACARIERLHLM